MLEVLRIEASSEIIKQTVEWTIYACLCFNLKSPLAQISEAHPRSELIGQAIQLSHYAIAIMP
jgi:hypothetical protein